MTHPSGSTGAIAVVRGDGQLCPLTLGQLSDTLVPALDHLIHTRLPCHIILQTLKLFEVTCDSCDFDPHSAVIYGNIGVRTSPAPSLKLKGLLRSLLLSNFLPLVRVPCVVHPIPSAFARIHPGHISKTVSPFFKNA